MRSPRWLATLVLLLLVGSMRSAAAADVAVWVYDFLRWSESQWQARSAALPPGTRHLYASVEDGPRFVLDDEFRAADIQRLVGAARERSGILTHAVMLQDTRWLTDQTGALERLARLVSLNRFRPEESFAGVHVDVAPHTLEEWECGGVAERRGLMQKLQALLGRIASGLPPPRGRANSPLQFSAALPWWIGALSADIPEAAPRRFFESLDEIVLMAYGDPGGSRVGGSAQALVSRLDDARLWRDVPAGKGIRIGLATYEYASAADLLAVAAEMDRTFSRQKAYRGTAIFHSTGSYGAPLTASVRGLVQDAAGQPVARASVRVGERQTATNGCGRFVLRDLPTAGVALEVKASGFQGVAVPVAGVAAGEELEVAPIVLNRNP